MKKGIEHIQISGIEKIKLMGINITKHCVLPIQETLKNGINQKSLRCDYSGMSMGFSQN